VTSSDSDEDHQLRATFRTVLISVGRAFSHALRRRNRAAPHQSVRRFSPVIRFACVVQRCAAISGLLSQRYPAATSAFALYVIVSSSQRSPVLNMVIDWAGRGTSIIDLDISPLRKRLIKHCSPKCEQQREARYFLGGGRAWLSAVVYRRNRALTDGVITLTISVSSA
jgi:hypothetical protein